MKPPPALFSDYKVQLDLITRKNADRRPYGVEEELPCFTAAAPS